METMGKKLTVSFSMNRYTFFFLPHAVYIMYTVRLSNLLISNIFMSVLIILLDCLPCSFAPFVHLSHIPANIGYYCVSIVCCSDLSCLYFAIFCLSLCLLQCLPALSVHHAVLPIPSVSSFCSVCLSLSISSRFCLICLLLCLLLLPNLNKLKL